MVGNFGIESRNLLNKMLNDAKQLNIKIECILLELNVFPIQSNSVFMVFFYLCYFGSIIAMPLSGA